MNAPAHGPEAMGVVWQRGRKGRRPSSGSAIPAKGSGGPRGRLAHAELPRSRRRVGALWSYQANLLRTYAGRQHVAAPDLALELPTGSGKTLVGLLIADWRRRARRAALPMRALRTSSPARWPILRAITTSPLSC
jgi:hypothetical protein